MPQWYPSRGAHCGRQLFPAHAGGLQRHRIDAARDRPVGRRVQLIGHRAGFPHRLFARMPGHSHPVTRRLDASMSGSGSPRCTHADRDAARTPCSPIRGERMRGPPAGAGGECLRLTRITHPTTIGLARSNRLSVSHRVRVRCLIRSLQPRHSHFGQRA